MDMHSNPEPFIAHATHGEHRSSCGSYTTFPTNPPLPIIDTPHARFEYRQIGNQLPIAIATHGTFDFFLCLSVI
jgi:hypothetical protein